MTAVGHPAHVGISFNRAEGGEAETPKISQRNFLVEDMGCDFTTLYTTFSTSDYSRWRRERDLAIA
jgi:hypothetical protein